jgi:small subunit ribosomal protein S17
MADEHSVNRKARVGTVVSDVNDQTIVVLVERAARHRLYKKVIRQTKRYHVHDPENDATLGDTVRIEEGRPVSKKKRWHLLEVLTERAVADVAPESLDEELVDEVQRTAARAAAEAADAAAPAETADESATDEAVADGAPSTEAETGEAPAAEAGGDADEGEAATDEDASDGEESDDSSDENSDAERTE